jgi:hypothetical protein
MNRGVLQPGRFRPIAPLSQLLTQTGVAEVLLALLKPLFLTLNAAAKAAGNLGFGAQWAGQGAPLARAGLPAAELVGILAAELNALRRAAR